MKMVEVKNRKGTIINYVEAVGLMEDELREDLHIELAPCTEQEFFSRYEREHEKRYGEEWELSKEFPIW